jgi:aminoglycoside phosphotransferase (APT) family kinase protein
VTDAAAVAKVVTDHAGRGDWSITRLHGFAGNAAYEAVADNRRLVVKMASARGVLAEAAVCERARRLGIPAAEVIAVDATGGRLGRPYLVMVHVGGQPVGRRDAVLREVGAHMRTLHDVTVDGFGWIEESEGGGLVGPKTTWEEAVTEGLAVLGDATDAGLMSIEMAVRIEQVVERHRDVLAAVQTARLVHGDVHPRHVYADDGRLRGIIDWGDAMGGDPLFDLGRLYRAEAASLNLVLEGYGPVDLPPDEFELRLHLYAVLFIVGSTAAELTSGDPWPEWFAHQAPALALHLDALRR